MSDHDRQAEDAGSAPATSAPAANQAVAGTRSEDRRGLDASGNSSAEGSALTPLDAFKIKCLNSALYHDDREKFLARINRLIMFVIVIFGASALTPIREKYSWIPAITAIAGLANLVFDIDGSARVHSSLRQRLYNILADTEVSSDLAQLERQLILVYADEPPVMYAVNAVAYNNAMLSYGRPTKELIQIGFLAKLFRHWIWFSANSFRTYSEASPQNG
jgi:hypothetical protein